MAFLDESVEAEACGIHVMNKFTVQVVGVLAGAVKAVMVLVPACCGKTANGLRSGCNGRCVDGWN